MLIAGDIGGTKTVLAFFSARGSNQAMLEKSYPSGQYASLEAMIAEYLREIDKPVDSACFAVAGPVVAGQGTHHQPAMGHRCGSVEGCLWVEECQPDERPGSRSLCRSDPGTW